VNGLLTVVAALFALNIVIAVIVILLRVRSNHQARRFDRIESRWEPVIS